MKPKKMMTMKILKTISKLTGTALLLCLFPTLLGAQEILTGFYHHDSPSVVRQPERQALTLPFYDDFTGSKGYPDSQLWSDSAVYINPGFPLRPVTRNAATFDVLDAQGCVYDYAISNPFISEYLTSNAIRLDSVFYPEPKALTPADSLYLSFFYQPQGNGNAPEAGDSLVLEFGICNETDTVWHHIWSTPGQTLTSFLQENDSNYFKQVMIPITDPQFFVNGFFLRFYNYASIVNQSQPSNRGNEDNWNIDVIYLNHGRNHNDTSYPKLCFTGPTPSFLKRYRAMPYSHYQSNPTANLLRKFEFQVSNLDNATHDADYHYVIDQVNGFQHVTSMTDSFKLDAETYCDTKRSNVDALFSIDSPYDSTSFLIKHYLIDNSCDPPMIDSMICHQGFYNYFAYDDGIPEMGYGVEPINSAFAVQFEMSNLDTLRGVQILFNHTLNDANNKYFNIVVWKDNNGKPGEEVYRLTNRKPKWEDALYRFAYYEFDQTVRLNGIFYVGIEQQSNGLINVGFDGSNDNSQYNFFNSTGTWQQSSKSGSIMIRPVVGKGYFIGLQETTSDPIHLYPNPVSGTLHIEGVESGASIILYDLTGRKVLQSSFAPEISVEGLSNGLYILSIITTNGRIFNKKISIKS